MGREWGNNLFIFAMKMIGEIFSISFSFIILTLFWQVSQNYIPYLFLNLFPQSFLKLFFNYFSSSIWNANQYSFHFLLPSYSTKIFLHFLVPTFLRKNKEPTLANELLKNPILGLYQSRNFLHGNSSQSMHFETLLVVAQSWIGQTSNLVNLFRNQGLPFVLIHPLHLSLLKSLQISHNAPQGGYLSFIFPSSIRIWLDG